MSRPDLSGMQIYGTDSFKPSEPVYWNQIEMRHIFTMDLGYGTLKLYADRIPAKYDKKGNVIKGDFPSFEDYDRAVNRNHLGPDQPQPVFFKAPPEHHNLRKAYTDCWYKMANKTKHWLEKNASIPGSLMDPIMMAFDSEWQEIYDDEGKAIERKILTRQYAFRIFDIHFAVIITLNPDYGNNGRFGSDLYAISSAVRTVAPNLPVHWAPGKNTRVTQAMCDKAKFAVTLVSHFGMGDLSSFYKGTKDLLEKTVSINGALVSPQSFVLRLRSACGHDMCGRNVTLTIRDSMSLAPIGKKSLSDLGEMCGTKKVSLPDGAISRMESFMKEDPVLFTQYAMGDCFVISDYITMLCGMNSEVPMSLGRMAADLFFHDTCERMGIKHTLKAYRQYLMNFDSIGFGAKMYMMPYDEGAYIAFRQATSAFYGGYNQSFSFGPCTEGPYTDVDLRSAYPVAMATYPDLDFSQPIKRICDVDLKEVDSSLFDTYTVGFGVVDFMFPENTYAPCIPIKDAKGRGLVFPLSGTSVHVSLPEVKLAIKMGANIRFRFFSFLPSSNKYTFGDILAQFAQNRVNAKLKYGDGSFQDIFWKSVMNSIYGKSGQGLASAPRYEKKDSGQVSAITMCNITNPFVVSHVTSLVRASVCAAVNQLHAKGYHVESATTDGLITNAPIEAVLSLDLYGFANVLREGFKILGLEGSLFEAKHTMDTFVNIKTRGNIAPNEEGVLAKAGLKLDSALKSKDPVTLRSTLIDMYMNREGAVKSHWRGFPSLKEMCVKGIDFLSREETRSISWEYDFKRCPLPGEDKKMTVGDVVYEHVYCQSRPWNTIVEFDRARKAHFAMFRLENGDMCVQTEALRMKRENTDPFVLRTREDVRDFHAVFWNCNHGYKPYKGLKHSTVLRVLFLYYMGFIMSTELDAARESGGLTGMLDLVYDRCGVRITPKEWHGLRKKSDPHWLFFIDGNAFPSGFPILFKVNPEFIKTFASETAIDERSKLWAKTFGNPTAKDPKKMPSFDPSLIVASLIKGDDGKVHYDMPNDVFMGRYLIDPDDVGASLTPKRIFWDYIRGLEETIETSSDSDEVSFAKSVRMRLLEPLYTKNCDVERKSA